MLSRVPIVDRYLATEILLTWAAVLFVLLLVLMSAEVARQLAWMAEGRIQGGSLLPLLLNSMLKNAILLLPLSCLLSILLAFGRLYKDSEMAAIMSAGIGPLRWYRPVIAIALPSSLLLLGMTLHVVPELNHYQDRILDEARDSKELSSMMAGRFNPSSSGNAVFFLEAQDPDARRSDGIFFRQTVDGVDRLDIAESAQSVRDDDGNEFLVMRKGRQYIGSAGEADFRIVEYEEYGIRLSSRTTNTQRSLKSLPPSSLLETPTAAAQAELQWRVTVPLGMFMLALLAVPLSVTRPRSGRYSRLALALFIYILYANLLGVSKEWIAAQTVPLWLGSWWVHVAAAALLLILLWRQGYLARSVRGAEA